MSVPEKVLSPNLETESELIKVAELTDKFEGYNHYHAIRIAILADAIAGQFNLARQDRKTLQQAALVHDIGELAMNRSYINRDGVLNREERIDMQRHPVIGEQETAKRGLPRAVQLLVRWHHEWWNGTGYPDGLERGQIPLAARILRVCDTYTAMTDLRPYSIPISSAEAKRYLAEWAGIEFDPKIVKAFLALEDLEELKSSADENIELSLAENNNN
jgi:HD-GYP domain-containing protein (c-di-GMP phosphodiesterase class II)